VLPGIELERLDDVEGLPAYAAPRDEPWVYDGRIVLRARSSSSYSSTAIRSSTRPKTNAPRTSTSAAATTR
jgi:hypothetical protein